MAGPGLNWDAMNQASREHYLVTQALHGAQEAERQTRACMHLSSTGQVPENTRIAILEDADAGFERYKFVNLRDFSKFLGCDEQTHD